MGEKRMRVTSLPPYPPQHPVIWKLVTQSCLTLLDCSPPGSSVHGILQARILERVAILFFKASSQPRDWTYVSCIAGRFFTIWAIREASYYPISKTLHLHSLQIQSSTRNVVPSIWGRTVLGHHTVKTLQIKSSNFNWMRESGEAVMELRPPCNG